MPNCQAILKSGKHKGKECNNKANKKHDGKYLCGHHDRKFRELKPSHVPLPVITRILLNDGSVRHALPDIHLNQRVAASEIVDHFRLGIHKVILGAQMQSGKSGTCKDVTVQFRDFAPDAICVVLLPINDNDLLAQARREFGAYASYIHGAPDIQCKQYLKQLMEHHPDNKFLIIMDESHYGVERGGAVDSYFSSAGLGIDGCYLPDNVYLLTVSATPNSETAMANHKGVARKTKIVILQPGPGYYGVSDMIRNQKLKSGWMLKGDGWDQLLELIDQYSTLPKYCIIRCNDCHGLDALRKLVHDRYRFISYDYTNKHIKDIHEVLDQVPRELTIVGIARRLSASKQLRTNNICMVFDYSEGEISTTMQGLVGRCCGYGKLSDNVDVYCNTKYGEVYNNWSINNFYPEGTPNDKYVSNGVTGKKSDSWEKNTPVKLDISSIPNSALRKRDYSNLRHILIPLLNAQHPQIAEHYGTAMSGNGVMVIDADSAESTKKQWWDDQQGPDRRVGMATHDDKDAGHYIYINKETHEAIVCYTRKIMPRGDPVVSDNCAYKPRIMPPVPVKATPRRPLVY